MHFTFELLDKGEIDICTHVCILLGYGGYGNALASGYRVRPEERQCCIVSGRRFRAENRRLSGEIGDAYCHKHIFIVLSGVLVYDPDYKITKAAFYL